MRTRELDPLHPDPEIIGLAARILRAGGVVLGPSDTVYGLHALMWSREAVERIRHMKARPLEEPFVLLVDSVPRVRELTRELDHRIGDPILSTWPSPVTLILPGSAIVPSWVRGSKGTVALRIPDQPFLGSLLARLRTPMVSTSANLSGAPDPLTVKEVPEQVLKNVDLVLDGGRAASEHPSTIVDATGDKLLVVRGGEWSL